MLQQTNPSLCVLPYSVVIPQRPEGWIPSLLMRKLKHREGKQLARRHTAGRWLSLNSNPLFLVSIPEWSMHLVGGWYLFDERMSELMNCPRSVAGQSRAGNSLSSRSQFLCFSAELWLSALMRSTFPSAPLPQDLKHLMCDVHYPPPHPAADKKMKGGPVSLGYSSRWPPSLDHTQHPSSIHIASSPPPTTSNPTCIVVNLFL